MDTISPEKRSWLMSRIHGRDTKPELIIRTLLHRAGYRFKIGDKTLPGRPDIVLPRHGLAIFVHGCFWHRHSNCKLASTPKTNRRYWREKFANNQRKDARAKRQLNALGWRVLTLWECRIMKAPEATLNRILKKLESNADAYEYALDASRQDILKAAEKKWRYLKD